MPNWKTRATQWRGEERHFQDGLDCCNAARCRVWQVYTEREWTSGPNVEFTPARGIMRGIMMGHCTPRLATLSHTT